tara:strand:+ start:5174 stop:5878 length:705 start_codon:yes stop_codon:yes gene_type:complete
MSPASGYTGPTFYGGFEFWSGTIDAGFSRRQIRNNSSPDSSDQIYLQSYNAGGFAGQDLSLAGVYVFNQEDFGGGLETGAVLLEGLSVSTTGFINTTDPTVEFDGRFVVQVDGGDYYVSETTLNLAQNNATFTLSGTDLMDELWALYNPSSKLNFDQGSGSFGSISLSTVTAVGIYFEEDEWTGTGASGTAYGLGIRSFEATGTSSIPEPAQSSLVLMGAACFAAVSLRRRSLR